MSSPIPALRYHRPTRQYYVWIGRLKKRKTFGSDPDVARRQYAQYLAAAGGPAVLPSPDSMTVNDALEAYRRFAKTRYTDRREANRIGTALAAVAELYGPQPAASFRAKALREVRGRLLTGGKEPRSRRYINKLTRSIQTAWRWLAGEELIPAESAASVCVVRALGPGDGGLEREPVLPPPPGLVEQTTPFLPPTVAAMVRVQLLSGMRPGEVCRMRAGEVSTDSTSPVKIPGMGRAVAAVDVAGCAVWMYVPGSHKTIRRGKVRVVPIGPRAQKELSPYLIGKGAGETVFATSAGRSYRSDSYAKAVARACAKAGVEPWSPIQLRHAAGTEVANRFDDHTAASVLGHAAGSTATRVYVEQSVRKAAAAAAEMG